MLSQICIGQIVGVHGIKGTVKIKPRLLDPSILNTLKPITNKNGTQTFEIMVKGKKNDLLLCQIKGINDRTTAEALKGCELFVPRSALPSESENEFYYCDLIGLTVLKDGQPFGVVSAINNYGAGDILDIQKLDGEILSLVFIQQNFPTVDLQKGILEVVLPHGLKGDTNED